MMYVVVFLNPVQAELEALQHIFLSLGQVSGFVTNFVKSRVHPIPITITLITSYNHSKGR
jgi:hypothetical protein